MINITRLFDFPYYQLEKYNKKIALATKQKGTWIYTSTQEYIDKANAISRALLKMGVGKNDKIAIICSSNRTEWNIIDIGVLQIGAQTVPIYPNISTEDCEFILNHSDSKYCFVSDELLFKKILEIKEKTPNLKAIYTFDEVENSLNWSELLHLGKDVETQIVVEEIKNSINAKDFATLIYTSGTTGRPKGVMLSHENIVSDVLNSKSRIPFAEEKSVALSFLPICHIFERFIIYLYQFYGVSIYFGESIEKISDNIKDVKPNVITAVPRLIEKIYEAIYSKGIQLKGIKKQLFLWSIRLGERYEPYASNGFWYEIQIKIARKLIFNKWKEGLGGNIELIISGSAALQPRLIKLFLAADIPIVEGYGLTETSPVISVNDLRNRNLKVGTVGKPIENVTVKIADDGEILFKGDNLMMGYYKEVEKTAEAIQNNFFHTGDIGIIDNEGFLKIVDRKKEMFKTSGGKYIAPQNIENTMKQSPFIEQIIVIGDGEKMPAAIIQPNFKALRDWQNAQNIPVDNSNEKLIANNKIIELLQNEIDTINEKFGHWEQIKRFELTSDIWSIENGQLTPTLKLKRKNIIEKYSYLYNKIYH